MIGDTFVRTDKLEELEIEFYQTGKDKRRVSFLSNNIINYNQEHFIYVFGVFISNKSKKTREGYSLL